MKQASEGWELGAVFLFPCLFLSRLVPGVVSGFGGVCLLGARIFLFAVWLWWLLGIINGKSTMLILLRSSTSIISPIIIATAAIAGLLRSRRGPARSESSGPLVPRPVPRLVHADFHQASPGTCCPRAGSALALGISSV